MQAPRWESARPLGTSRLRACIMKANVNYNLEGDEEAGVFGKAQNLRLTTSVGHFLNLRASLARCQNMSIYNVSGTLALEACPEVSIGHLRVLSCQLHLNLESTLNSIWHHVSDIWSLVTPEKATTRLQCQQKPVFKSQGPQIHEGQGQEGTNVFSKSYQY